MKTKYKTTQSIVYVSEATGTVASLEKNVQQDNISICYEMNFSTLRLSVTVHVPCSINFDVFRTL